jgi:hypothetical protein
MDFIFIVYKRAKWISGNFIQFFVIFHDAIFLRMFLIRLLLNNSSLIVVELSGICSHWNRLAVVEIRLEIILLLISELSRLLFMASECLFGAENIWSVLSGYTLAFFNRYKYPLFIIIHLGLNKPQVLNPRHRQRLLRAMYTVKLRVHLQPDRIRHIIKWPLRLHRASHLPIVERLCIRNILDLPLSIR